VSVALELEGARGKRRIGDADPGQMVKRMQKLIDSGFTTFQLKAGNENQQQWAESNLYGRLRKHTPLSVLNTSTLVVPLTTPFSGESATPSAVRRTVLESMQRMDAECIDALQLKCK
jgi:hypothetical protein